MTNMFVASAMLLSALPVLQEAKPPWPLLTVSGTAEVSVIPDEAVVNIGVLAEAPTGEEAQLKANASLQKMLQEMDRLKVSRQNVQSSELTLSQDVRQVDGRVIRLFAARSILSVRLSDFGLIGKVIDAGLASGANVIHGLQFRLKDDRSARLRALRDAVAAAMSKAQAMAEALEMQLAGVYDVQESGAQIFPPPMLGESLRAAATPIEPGQLTISAGVTIRYVLQPKK